LVDAVASVRTNPAASARIVLRFIESSFLWYPLSAQDTVGRTSVFMRMRTFWHPGVPGALSIPKKWAP